MAQEYGIDIQRWNGTDYDTLKPTPDAHADTHKATGSDPIVMQTGNYGNKTVTSDKLGDAAVVTSKIANNAVTRAKLAQDTLYSPLSLQESSYTLTVNDIGETILSDSSQASDVRVITLNNANNNNFPIGTEIAIMAGNTGTTKLTVEAGIGVRGNKDGDVLASDGITVTIPRYCMIALKKFYAEYWLITGVFEVVS